jgi:hypothetical protein
MESMLNSKNSKKILYFVPNLLKDAQNAFQLASLEIPYNDKFPQYRYNSRDQVQEENKFVTSLLLLVKFIVFSENFHT